MNFAIAARSMNTVGGVKEYLEGLAYGFSQIDTPHEIFFFMSEDGTAPTFESGVTVVKRGGSGKLQWDYITLPQLLREHNIDAVLHTKNVRPATVRTPSVVTVHDLLHITQPSVYKWTDSLYMRTMMRRTLPNADHIIAVSSNTKNDLLQHIPRVKENKVNVVYEDAMPKFDARLSDEQLQLVRRKYNLAEKTILFTGSLSPRKNIERLLEAFSRIAATHPHQLVITGSKAWKAEHIKQQIARLNIHDRVHLTGFVEDEDMPALYQNASLYVYPSLYEGFGIPILEAYASGVPVVCSSTSSLPEVAGDAAVLINPLDTNALADGISRALSDESLRTCLIQKGHEQRQRFSWKKAAEETLDLLQLVSIKEK